MRIARREKRFDVGAALRAMGFVFLCIVVLLLVMEFVIVGVRFFVG